MHLHVTSECAECHKRVCTKGLDTKILPSSCRAPVPLLLSAPLAGATSPRYAGTTAAEMPMPMPTTTRPAMRPLQGVRMQ